MGNFMVPCCCICGKAAKRRHDDEWMNAGGLQDFCPEHANLLRECYGEFDAYLWGDRCEDLPKAEIEDKGVNYV